MGEAENSPEQIRVRSLVCHLLRFFTTVQPLKVSLAMLTILGLDELPPRIIDLIEPNAEVSSARGGDCGLCRNYFGILIFHAYIIPYPAEECNNYFAQILHTQNYCLTDVPRGTLNCSAIVPQMFHVEHQRRRKPHFRECQTAHSRERCGLSDPNAANRFRHG